MKTNLAKYVSSLVLLGTVTAAPAQTTWNYFISDAGSGNSLLTWNVTGSLATPPGAFLISTKSSLLVSVEAPGIFNDAYVASGALQSIPTPDGSYFQLDNSSVYQPIEGYEDNNVPGSGNDSFGLLAHLFPHQGDPGHAFLYNPGTQSVFIPIAYSNFNPGVYQSQEAGFSTPLTVNLTVGPVPEPSVPALSALGGLFGLGILRRWKKSF